MIAELLAVGFGAAATLLAIVALRRTEALENLEDFVRGFPTIDRVEDEIDDRVAAMLRDDVKPLVEAVRDWVDAELSDCDDALDVLRRRVDDLESRDDRVLTLARYLRTFVVGGAEDPDRGRWAVYEQRPDDPRSTRIAAVAVVDAIDGTLGSARSGDNREAPPVRYDSRLGIVFFPVAADVDPPGELGELDLVDDRPFIDPVVVSTGTRTALGDGLVGGDVWQGDRHG